MAATIYTDGRPWARGARQTDCRDPAKPPPSVESSAAVRDVTAWLTRHPDSPTDDERLRLKAILDRCPELQAASGQVRAFAAMLTQLNGQDLPSGSPPPATPTCPASRRSPGAWNRTATPSPTV
jgi:hypothetical protein